MDAAHVISRLDRSYDDCRKELLELLRIPSISTQSEHRGDMVRAAEWLAQLLQRAGFAARLTPTAGHPVVIGEWDGAGERAPAVLVYGHYDVQPADPLESWESPPFEPTVRADRIYARGATDDKGQLFAHLKALRDVAGCMRPHPCECHRLESRARRKWAARIWRTSFARTLTACVATRSSSLTVR
jgi:acetylornithine deacetylase/succinyl-diaminopimelate desuccinylase-like protein